MQGNRFCFATRTGTLSNPDVLSRLMLALVDSCVRGAVPQGGGGPACRGGRAGVLFQSILLRQEGFTKFSFLQKHSTGTL